MLCGEGGGGTLWPLRCGRVWKRMMASTPTCRFNNLLRVETASELKLKNNWKKNWNLWFALSSSCSSGLKTKVAATCFNLLERWKSKTFISSCLHFSCRLDAKPVEISVCKRRFIDGQPPPPPISIQLINYLVNWLNHNLARCFWVIRIPFLSSHGQCWVGKWNLFDRSSSLTPPGSGKIISILWKWWKNINRNQFANLQLSTGKGIEYGHWQWATDPKIQVKMEYLWLNLIRNKWVKINSGKICCPQQFDGPSFPNFPHIVFFL